MLPLLGIVALLVAGFVVLLAALTYDESLAHERRRQRKLGVIRAKAALRRWRNATALAWSRPADRHDSAREWNGRPRPAIARIIRAAVEGETRWRNVGHAVRFERNRWLRLESTSGQLLAGIVASLVVAFLIVALV